jgi:methyl-accepting chemotaxis protein
MILNPHGDKNELLVSLKIFKDYVKADINNLNDLKKSCSNQHFKEIEQEIFEIANLLETRNKDSLTVYGEIMLSCEKLSDGFTNDKIVSNSIDPKLNYIAKSLNSMFEKLDDSIHNALDILNEFGKQNFLHSIDESVFRGGQLKNLLIGINKLKNKITEDLKDSHRECLVLEHESLVLKDKANLLSASTQKQSVAIEETTAAIVEISSSIKSNTESAVRMLNLGKNVKDSLETGKKLADDTHTSMEEINASTQSVYDAISVISQIAFQTNILSLNAAVEAATAGEAGKGFAVVAGEVRNLAGRSAEAANEIGSLMDELKQKAENGKNIASNMQEDYTNLTNNVDETVDYIDRIVDATKEQANGIALIEDSINSIDSAVGENSAISDDVSYVATQTHQVAKKILEKSNKAQFHGKEKIEIRQNSLLRRDGIGSPKDRKH